MGRKKCNLSINLFDSTGYRTIYDGLLKDARKMKVEEYSPGAMTPLYDAIGKTITLINSVVKKKDKVIIIIDTDGYENHSVEFDQPRIKALIGKAEKAGWAFVFMASGIDIKQAREVATQGGLIGVGTANTVMGTHAMRYDKSDPLAQATSCYFQGTVSNLQVFGKKKPGEKQTETSAKR
jgi:hypothetical protein